MSLSEGKPYIYPHQLVWIPSACHRALSTSFFYLPVPVSHFEAAAAEGRCFAPFPCNYQVIKVVGGHQLEMGDAAARVCVHPLVLCKVSAALTEPLESSSDINDGFKCD